jgi:hypothetical protein
MTPRRTDEHDGPLRIYLEEGRRRTFAMALDWPGWGRSARDAEGAVERLLAYRPRYVAAIRDAGAGEPEPPAGTAGAAVDVVARLPGNATTDFGAPGVVPPFDREGWPAHDAERQTRLLAASWRYLDAVADAAPPVLRKGPRGGGRDRDAIVEHVLGTEPAYARKAGLRSAPPKDRPGHDAMRHELLQLLLTSSPGVAGTASGWPGPYAVRRLAWHALDHAWEIEDRAQPADEESGVLRS